MDAAIVTTRDRGLLSRALGMLARSRAVPEDFAGFYRCLAPTMLRFFARATRDPQVAFDLMAETFAKAFEKRGDFKGSRDDQAAAWVWSIARNELAKYKRSLSVELAAITRLGLERPASSESELREVERLTALEDIVREQIPEALERLSPDQQQVIRLRFYEDLSNEEIAKRLAVPNDVVRARISRALRLLSRNEHLQSAVKTLVDS